MNRGFIKICGITNSDDALMAIEAGADALGFVFAESPRQVLVADVSRISAVLPRSVPRIGVFVSAPTMEEAAAVDVVQLHGSHKPANELGVRLWRAVAMPVGESSVVEWNPFVEGFLFDTAAPGKHGGTGKSFDWSLVRPLLRSTGPGLHTIVAGGLRAENVAEAIRQSNADGVDVSSGVERALGRKDRARVRAFIAAARAEFARMPEVPAA